MLFFPFRQFLSLRTRRVTSALLLFSAIYGGFGPALVEAQQVLVDDPMSVVRGAAQLEAWHSREASWIIPAVHVFPALEMATGVGFHRIGRREQRRVEYSIEGKLLVRPGAAHRFGVAAVGGASIHHIRIPRGRPASLYVTGILSQDLLPGRFTAYQNVGWLHEEHGPHQLTWGGRLDWTVLDRVILIGEVYGEGQTAPSLQLALRTVLLPDHLEMDVSVTRTGPSGDGRTWTTVGLTFMSTPLY